MEAVASVLTIVQAAIAVSQGIKKLQRWKNAPKALSRFQDEVAEYANVLSEIEHFLQAGVKAQPTSYNVSQSLTLASAKLKRSLLDLETFLNDMTKEGTFNVRRAHWMWNEHRIERLKTRLAEAQTYLMLTLSTSALISQASVGSRLQQEADLNQKKLSGVERQMNGQELRSSLRIATSNEQSERKQCRWEDDTPREAVFTASTTSSSIPHEQAIPEGTRWTVRCPERCLRLYNTRPSKSNIFHFARMDFVGAVKKLLTTGQASLLDVDRFSNKTALDWSIVYESWSTVDFLLRSGSAASLKELCYAAVVDLNVAIQSGKVKSHPTYDRLTAVAKTKPQGVNHLYMSCREKTHDPSPETSEGKSSSIDIVDEAGRTALYVSAMLGDSTKVEYLLEKGADPNIFNHQGRTPLHAAARAGDSASMKTLLKKCYRADINVQDAFGCTPLLNAVSKADGKLVAQMLLESGADVNIANCRGWRPVHVLTAHNKSQWLSTLATADADLNAIDKDGFNLWSMAIYNEANDVLEYLLTCTSISYNAIKCGTTILHFAAYFGSLETLAILKSPRLYNVDAAVQDGLGRTALQIAEWRRDNNLEWFHKSKTVGPGNSENSELDEDPQAWFAAFRGLVIYLESLESPIH